MVIATESREFRSPDFRAVKAARKTPDIFDGRDLYEPFDVVAFGSEYRSIGRRVSNAGRG